MSDQRKPTAHDLARTAAEPYRVPELTTEPLAPPIYLSSVYRCQDPQQAGELLSGEASGYVYSRCAHPNGDMLAERCRQLHSADVAVMAASGMSAMSAVLLAHLGPGDRIVAARELYGSTLNLLTKEVTRLGVACELVDACDLNATSQALASGAKLLIVETISNPRLRVSPLSELARLAHAHDALLVVDNSFASPAVCQPITLGADLVLESLTKIMSGHGDVFLGLICGRQSAWDRIEEVLRYWGFSASPFDCWLAQRGLQTLALRCGAASDHALEIARYLADADGIASVDYPGLPDHPDHELAREQFLDGQFGSMVTFQLAGGRPATEALMRAVPEIPFCPSLGELSTTLSHPLSTSHRQLSAEAREQLGIDEGTIRLSVGIEPTHTITASLAKGLAAAR